MCNITNPKEITPYKNICQISPVGSYHTGAEAEHSHDNGGDLIFTGQLWNVLLNTSRVSNLAPFSLWYMKIMMSETRPVTPLKLKQRIRVTVEEMSKNILGRVMNCLPTK